MKAWLIGVVAALMVLGVVHDENRITDLEHQVNEQQGQLARQYDRDTELYNMIATVRQEQLQDRAATSASVTVVPEQACTLHDIYNQTPGC